MAPLPTQLCDHLMAQGYSRNEAADVVPILRSLGAESHPDITEFYSRFTGGFGSPFTGVELLDFFGPAPQSVEQATRVTQQMHGLPPRFLVISELLANAIYVADTVTGAVYNVDFEGGDELLRRGELETQGSFADFLLRYFLGQDGP